MLLKAQVCRPKLVHCVPQGLDLSPQLFKDRLITHAASMGMAAGARKPRTVYQQRLGSPREAARTQQGMKDDLAKAPATDRAA